MPTTYTHTYDLTPQAQSVTPVQMHKLLMASLDAPHLDPEHPRADAALLWRRSGDTLLVHTHERITLPEHLFIHTGTTALEPTDPGSTVTVTGDIARYYTPMVQVDPDTAAVLAEAGLPARPRVKPAPVPDDRLTDWIAAKLRRLDLEMPNTDPLILTGPDLVMDNDRSARIPTARFTVQVTGGAALDELLRTGIGKARNYGLGLITTN